MIFVCFFPFLFVVPRHLPSFSNPPPPPPPQNERGHPFQADFCLIDRLQHLKIRQIACGGEHSVAVAENGEVNKEEHYGHVLTGQDKTRQG